MAPGKPVQFAPLLAYELAAKNNPDSSELTGMDLAAAIFGLAR